MSDPTLRLHLATYDVRLKRELAHRRFVASVVRQVLRLVTLHTLDAAALGLVAWGVSRVLGVALTLDAALALVVFVLAGLYIRGSYRAGEARRDIERIVVGVFIGAVLAALPGTMIDSARLSSEFIFMFALGSVAALIIERRVVDALVHQAYARGIGLRRALIVARGSEFQELLDLISPKRSESRRTPDDHVIVGYLTPDHRDSAALGALKDLEHILESQDISEVLIATSLRERMLEELAQTCFECGVRVLVIPAGRPPASIWTDVTRVGGLPAYHLHPPRLELPALVLKRATDLLLSGVGLVAAAPLMLLIAVAIKLETRGPVFFRQRRVGLGGREFMMWKFRSMQLEAEVRQDEIAHLNPYGDGRLFKLRSDPRVTGVGRFLRRFSLDELPQLLNILSGDMSLVGPRPPLPAEVQKYEPRHLVRLSVVPGLTGPWQVNGRNLITDFEEVVRLERDYIETWSLRSDLEIIVRTLGVVLSGKGAY